MSDGPHKSLPMRPGWRRVAERAASPAYEPADICDALQPALARDWGDEVPGELVRGLDEILRGPQHLFRDEQVRRLESLRPLTAAHGLGVLVLECAIEVAIAGDGDPDALVTAVANALALRASRGALQVEEHYCRASRTPRAQNVRTRIDQGIGGTSFTDLARQLLNRQAAPASRSPAKQQGLDDGVRL